MYTFIDGKKRWGLKQCKKYLKCVQQTTAVYEHTRKQFDLDYWRKLLREDDRVDYNLLVAVVAGII